MQTVRGPLDSGLLNFEPQKYSMNAVASQPPGSTTGSGAPAKKKREWAPLIWCGADLGTWLKLLASHHGRVHWTRAFSAAFVTYMTANNSLLGLLQSAFCASKIRKQKIVYPPLFVIGHWRSGTTLLHELLVLDPEHVFPTTFQCLSPCHCLLTEKLITRCFAFLVPSKRPMDNMALGWNRPQEDEFALCNLGAPSPYRTIAFPNDRPADGSNTIDMQDLSESEMRRWKETFVHFVKMLAFKYGGKRLVLKSPPHTGRVRVLLELFPDAKFVHIVRDPFVLYPSTVNLWKSLYRLHAFQKPPYAHLEEEVLDNLARMYAQFEQDRALIPPQNYFQLKYEDLVQSPTAQIQAIYEHLQLGDFSTVAPRLAAYLDDVKDYQTNKYQLSDEERATVRHRWKDYLTKYGYG